MNSANIVGVILMLVGSLFFLAIVAIPVIIVVRGIRRIVKAGKDTIADVRNEKELFRQMLLNPCDATVLAYMPALNQFYDTSTLKLEKADMTEHRTRQIQGFYTIYQNPNVSQSVKEQLKNCYILNGLTSMTGEDFAGILKKTGTPVNPHSNDHLQEEMQRQHDEWTMEEGRKSVTPFDMGGYVQGDGFNPSDTMAADAQREQMNQMNDMGTF